MPFKLEYTKPEDAPEAVRGELTEEDGKFFLEVETAKAFNAERSKLKTLRGDLDKKTAALGRYSKFQELQDDELDELLHLREMKKQGKPLTADERAELERLNKKSLDKLTSELTAEREARQKDQSELKRFKLVNPLRVIATSDKVGMFPEDFDLAWNAELNRFFKLAEEEGKKPRIVVLDEDGDETDVKPEDFFNKVYKQQRPKFFKATGAGGSGATQAGGGANRNDLGKLPATERLKAARQAGLKE
jgi:hypothetical protein